MVVVNPRRPIEEFVKAEMAFVWHYSTDKAIPFYYDSNPLPWSQVALSSDCRHLALSDDDELLGLHYFQLWRIEEVTSKLVQLWSAGYHKNDLASLRAIALSSDGSRIFAAIRSDPDLVLVLWNTSSDSQIKPLQERTEPDQRICKAEFTDDGQYIIYTTEYSIVILNGSTLKRARRYPWPLDFDLPWVPRSKGLHINSARGTLLLSEERKTPEKSSEYCLLRRRIGLTRDKKWILWHSHKIMWIPLAYRRFITCQVTHDASGTKITLGRPYGKPFMFQFEDLDGVFGSIWATEQSNPSDNRHDSGDLCYDLNGTDVESVLDSSDDGSQSSTKAVWNFLIE